MSETAARMTLDSAGADKQLKQPARRRSVLDLAPLELACMNALWPVGEASVRDIRARMSPACPRAYTTIMTIMERLTRKGIVERRRVGRAWLYRPNLSAEEARAHAVAQIVEGFFGGSAAALAAQLSGVGLAQAIAHEPKAVVEAAKGMPSPQQSESIQQRITTSAPASANDLPPLRIEDNLL